MRRDGRCRIRDVAQVGLVILVQRSGDANDDGIHLGQTRIVRGRFESLPAGLLNLTGQDADDVGTALGQSGYFALIDVEASDPKPFLCVQQGEGQTYVAETNDGDPRLTLFNLPFQLRNRTRREWRSRHLKNLFHFYDFTTLATLAPSWAADAY